MPPIRRRNITGRSRRTATRARVRNIRNNINNSNEDVNENENETEIEVDNLIAIVKCALNPVSPYFETHSLGSMELVCQFCNARHFNAEVTNRDRTSFSLCCHKGKVNLPTPIQNDFFKELIEGISSLDRNNRNRSVDYLGNIRSYNAAFAMISSEAQLDESVMHGIYHFKIHNAFFHRSGPVVNNNALRAPCYAQLYFYDVDTAMQYRMNERSNSNCSRELMRGLNDEMSRINPFVRSFQSMSEYCQNIPDQSAEVCMIIKVNRDVDVRRFNDAVQTDVAAIFSSVNGEPPFERNMIVFSKNSNEIRNISVLDSALDPLAYPLLFPNGETGWHVNITHNVASTSTASIRRNKVTMLQYASYHLAIREQFSILQRSQKLYLQWIVDIYVRIEGSRLNFIRQNQSSLRAEVYSNLTDFLNNNNNDNNNEYQDNRSIGRQIILPSSFIGSPRNMYQNYLDTMSIVRHFGKPSLFITMTCNL